MRQYALLLVVPFQLVCAVAFAQPTDAPAAAPTATATAEQAPSEAPPAPEPMTPQQAPALPRAGSPNPESAAGLGSPPPAPGQAAQGPANVAPGDATAGSEPTAPQAGYFTGQGFILRTADEQSKLRVGLQSAMRAQVTIDGKAQVSNPFMTLRPILEGSLYRKWIRYWTSLELAANPVYLLDAYVEVQPIEAFGLRMGQQWTPFSRHEYLYGPQQLLMPEWDAVANYFWTGRDKGITAFGTLGHKMFEYQVGGYVGSPLRQFQTIRGNYLFVARVGINPNGVPGATEFAYAEKNEDAPFRYAIGVNGFTSKANASTENFNPSTFQFDVVPGSSTKVNTGIGADFFLQSSRVVVLAEGYLRRTDPHQNLPKFTSVGAFGQIGVLLYKRALDGAVRFSWADVNVDQGHDTAYGLELASTWYVHAPNVMFRLRYAYGNQLTPPGSTTMSGGAPLILQVGHLHVMTAQVNLAF